MVEGGDRFKSPSVNSTDMIRWLTIAGSELLLAIR
jgi:hypothetical protein